jgi:hypothetical protein
MSLPQSPGISRQPGCLLPDRATETEARDERFASFAQVIEGAVLFGGIGPSIMSLMDGPLALVNDGSRTSSDQR